ncbi:MAG TPA: hypothetical protein V6D28_17880 [Leptolyngbyaceae cyanobacterium]
MQNEEEKRKDINEIKSELITLRTEFYNLIEILKESFPEVTQIRGKSGLKNVEDTEQKKTIVSVINYSIIKDPKIKKLAFDYNKNIGKSKDKKDFYKFCYYVAGLVEEIAKVFLERKFRELQKGKNIDLSEAYSLVNINFKPSGKLRLPNIYVSWLEQGSDESNNYHLDGNQYLSLIELRKGDSWFLLDMCFAILWKTNFYEQKNKFSFKNYEEMTRKNKQIIPAAIQRQSSNVKISNVLLNMEYYFRLNNIRTFRNKYEHNKSNTAQFNQEIDFLKNYVKVDIDNYNGILEAANWLLIQLDFL